MTLRQTHQYRFGDELPVAPVDSGTTLLVAGSSLSDARQLALQLVLAGSDYDEGMVAVSTSASGGRLLEECEGLWPDIRLSNFGLVDCTGKRDLRERFPGLQQAISAPTDLTGISIELSLLYEAFLREDITPIRTGVDSVTSLLSNLPFRTVCRFLHTLTGRIAAMDGLGVFYVDLTTQDEAAINTITHLCDGRLDVRKADGGSVEVRIRGLRDQPSDWLPLPFDA